MGVANPWQVGHSQLILVVGNSRRLASTATAGQQGGDTTGGMETAWVGAAHTRGQGSLEIRPARQSVAHEDTVVTSVPIRWPGSPGLTGSLA